MASIYISFERFKQTGAWGRECDRQTDHATEKCV